MAITTAEIELQDRHTSTPPSLAEASERGSVAAVLEERSRDSSPPRGKPVEAFDSYPDGGLNAWLQVLACFSLFFTTLGGIYCWGVMQEALFEAGVAPSSTLSFIGSTQATIEALFAVPISRLVAAYGPRRVAIVGSILAGLGPILAGSCSHSVAGLIITEGFLFGFGQALVFFCAATLPAQFFLRRRNIATGLVYSGAGIGGAIFSIVAAELLKRFSIAWTFRILGLLFTAINLPAAFVLKSRAKKAPLFSKAPIVDWSLFKDLRFTFLLVGGAIALFPLFVAPFFLPLFGTSLGLTPSTSSYLLAGFNLSSAAGRIGWGVGADAWTGSVNAIILCMGVFSISTLLIWPFATSLGPLIAFALINGLCAGGFFSLFPGVMSTLFGSSILQVAFPMIVFSWAPGYFAGAPVAGYLLGAFGGPEAGYEAFRPAIYYAGGLGLASTAMLVGARLTESRVVWKRL